MNTTVINKKLDLGMSYLGGLPKLYARNVIRGGDWANVCHISGLCAGEIKDTSKVLISMNKEFDSASNLEQVKNFLKSINTNIEFANDCPSGNFLDPKDVLREASKNHKLMNFEKDLILENKATLHRIYVSAIQNNKQVELPAEFTYEWQNGSLYPLYQVYKAVCTLLSDNNA